MTIRTTDGQSYSARVEILHGDPTLPLTDDELVTKYGGVGETSCTRET